MDLASSILLMRSIRRGLKYTAIFAGARKNDFSPNEPLSKEAAAYLQSSVDKMHKLFCATVARNRGLTEQAVRDMDAACYEGTDAVTVGLADAVLSFDEAVSRLVNTITEQGGKQLMSTETKTGLQNQLAALSKGSTDVELTAALAPLGFVPTSAAADLDKATKEAAATGRAEGLQLAGNIITMAAESGLPEMAASLLQDGAITKETAGERILAAKVAQDEGHGISGAQSPEAGGHQVNPLLADAQQRAKSATIN